VKVQIQFDFTYAMCKMHEILSLLMIVIFIVSALKTSDLTTVVGFTAFHFL
jgi:hypothetical protein